MERNNYDYDQIKEGYYDDALNKGNGAQAKWHELKFRRVIKLIQNESPKTLLDIACGPGTFISKLSNEIDCYGIDIAQKQIDYANNKYGSKTAKFFTCKKAEYPFEDNKFDVITSIEFIEHISPDDCRKNLAEIKRCLKKNGKVILTTPNYKSIWPFLEFVVSKVTEENYLEQHITKYHQDLLKKMMIENGFINVKVESYLFISPFFAYLSDKLSDYIFDIEEKHIKKWGNLLIATGEIN